MKKSDFLQHQRIQVSLDFSDNSSSPLGELMWDRQEKRAIFKWSEQALKSKIELSSLKLPLSKAFMPSSHSPFNGLHGLFSDSIPDGFGLRLMNKGLIASG